MPATTTRQSATASSSRTASSRWSPATPTSETWRAAEPYTRAVSAASAATGASLVPAETTTTWPCATGSGPSVTARATGCDDGVRVGGHDGVERRLGEPGREHGAVRVREVEAAEDLDDLLRSLALAVDDLRVTGAGGAVGVETSEAEVDGLAPVAGHAIESNRPLP